MCACVCVCVSVCVCERERDNEWQRKRERDNDRERQRKRERETDSEQRFAIVCKKPSEEIEQERKHSSWQWNNVSMSPKKIPVYLSEISLRGLFSSITLFQ